MKNVVVMGGGSGMSSLLKGLKRIDTINLSAIVTVADDGGSTAQMRKEFKIPAVGDLRQIIVALSSHETILNELMKYRFDSSNYKKAIFNQHSLGNLIISALIKIKGGFYEGIETLSDVFNVKGKIHPIAKNPHIKLLATYTDGTKITGEHKIPNRDKKIKSIQYANLKQIKTNEHALNDLAKADYLVLSTGSLFTSIIPNLIAPKVIETITKNKKLKIVYAANVMTQPGETHDMNLSDHLLEIEKYLKPNKIDKIVVHQGKIKSSLLKKYAREEAFPVEIDKKAFERNVEFVFADLIDSSDKNLIRHDSEKIAKTFAKIFVN